MAEINQFPSRVETGFGEEKIREVKKKEFHMPHPHGLSPFQKLICVLELLFTAWLIYVTVQVIITNIVRIIHVLQ